MNGQKAISIHDFHGLVEMLIVCAQTLDAPARPPLHARMEALIEAHGHVLQ